MPSRLLTIGEVSDLLGITRRAIRHYEQRGLIEAMRNTNGVRLFDDAARKKLESIARLRRTGIGLRDIEEILSAGARSGDQTLQLQLTIDKLNARATQLRDLIGQIEAAIATILSAMPVTDS